MNDEDDLKLQALYRESRQEQPSAELDRQIHNAASRALYRKKRHWLWQLSTAAVVLLSFSVVLNLLIDEPETPETMLEEQVLSETLGLAKSPKPAAEAEAVAGAPAESSSAREAPMLMQAPAARALQKDKKPGTEPAQSQRMLADDAVIATTEQDNEQPSFQFPRLPADLDGLLKLAEGLRGVQRADATINLYHRDKLILRVQPAEDSTRYLAWPGAEILGVAADWSYTPQSSSNCSQPVPYRRCELTSEVDGFFEGERLDHISWRQLRDE